MECLVCRSDSRPVRYRSSRVQICQWCVSLLCAEPIDPDEVTAEVTSSIAEYVQSRHGPKADVYYEHIAAKQLGVPERAGFFESIFMRRRVEERLRKTSSRASEVRSAEHESFNEQRARLEREALECALRREHQPTKVSFGYRGWAKVEDLVNPKMVKYFNAINLNLIAGMSKLQRPSEAEWREIRQQVLLQDEFRCRACGEKPREKHVHHIIPISKFGSNHVNNLITLCYSCHNKAHPEFTVSRNAP
jgi:hypothetical protein